MNWSQSQRVKTLLLALAFLATFGIFLTWLSRRQSYQNVPTLRPKTQDQSPTNKDQRLDNTKAQSSPTPIVQPSGLIIPVAGVTSEQLIDTFSAARGEGRVHDAIDIPAPQGTAVLAVAGGKILKLFQSKAGGTTVYQLSGDEKFIYYYAHLDRYAEGLHEGQIVRQGETIAYVGDTGNAGPGNYHLHFSIAVTSDPKRWSEGVPINPYPLLRR
jgi:peptidoglycan LD-endopeptidase LytH